MDVNVNRNWNKSLCYKQPKTQKEKTRTVYKNIVKKVYLKNMCK